MVKKKQKQKVVIKTDKKGRYFTIKGRKYYLKPKQGISERELIKFIINRLHRRRRKGAKKEKKQQRSYPTPSAADSWISSTIANPIEAAQAYSKAVLNNKLAQLDHATKQLQIEGASPLALPSAVEDALVGYEATNKKVADGNKRMYIKGKAYDLPEEVYDELAKGVNLLMKQHEDARKKAEAAQKKAEEAEQKKEEEKQKRESIEKTQEDKERNEQLRKARERIKIEERIAKQAKTELKVERSLITLEKLVEIGNSIQPKIVRTYKQGGKQKTRTKAEMFDAIYKQAPNKLVPFIEKQITVIKKRENIQDDEGVEEPAQANDQTVVDWGAPSWSMPTIPEETSPPPQEKKEENKQENKPENKPPEVHVHIHPLTPPKIDTEPISEPPTPQTSEPPSPLSDADKEFFKEYRLQDGSGNNTDKGLDTEQIDKIMMKYSPVYVGTIPRDYIKKLVPTARKQKEIAAVVNLDNSNQKGSHWVSLYINAKPGGSQTVEVFDSFGRPTPRDIVRDIKQVVDAMKLDTYLKFKENRVPVQSAKSSNCGYFSMRFLIDRFRGKSFADASGYTECRPNVVNKNEKEIEKLKKQAPFSYI
jgi:hypothetical protein